MNLTFQVFILFISAFLGGIVLFFIPKIKSDSFKYSLMFSGSYLFAITILHILPDLFSHYTRLIGLCTIAGFFLQLFLEFFSGGIEHGHLYSSEDTEHQHKSISSFSLLITLCIHALLDGIILINPHPSHSHSHNGIFLGIILHKAPAAFALVAILLKMGKSKKSIILKYLTIFALASPVGILVSKLIIYNNLISNNAFLCLWAMAGGSFLNISTTIFFESNPDHHLNKRQVLASSFGVLLAILTEYLH